MTKDTPITISLAAVATVAVLMLWFTYREPVQSASSIGGTVVPHLHCEEDEVIGFDQSGEDIPAPLVCVHVDALAEVGLSPDAAAQGREEDAYSEGYKDGLAAG